MSETTKELELKRKEEVAATDGEPTRAGIKYMPVVDIYETEEDLTLVADLPGVAKEDLDVDIKDRVLTITGFVKESEARLKSNYSEYGIGGYTRQFTLSDAIDQGHVGAALKDGVLTLTLPKAERLKRRKVEITA
ncbi:MAG: Hsp20/alpha crystallin family protein [Proteobacteria bacterium]|nr:Hsp20/alpha crystallin family protein [Pseudomonadota bacterium]